MEAEVEAVVNTVNTVGVMGKGIALMFKERFPENYKTYAKACKANEVEIGRMFVWSTDELTGPKWVINFPTKKHWRSRTKLEWIESGLESLRRTIDDLGIRSIAVPPLGCGNGGLEWKVVRPLLQAALRDLDGVEVLVYEPTSEYQNVAKRSGVNNLTPARALVAELVRRYWVLGIECTILEVQKLAWFLGRYIERMNLDDPLDLRFEADRYGPYADRLTHLLNSLDGSYLHCDKRLADAGPMDTIWFDESQREKVHTYLYSGEAKKYTPALEATDKLIDGFQSPLCMEALATVDWLVYREACEPTLKGIRRGLSDWSAGEVAATRKHKIFDDDLLGQALARLEVSLFDQ